MNTLTERYLAVALRGMRAARRADLERELRSSIADAVEDRIARGLDPEIAERTALEDLGDPARLSAELTGRPLHLIGPELFLDYRDLLVRLVGILAPVVGIVVAAIELSTTRDMSAAIARGAGAGITTAVQIAFWVTVAFAAIERFDAGRDVRDELRAKRGRWTVDRLPQRVSGSVGIGETAGEVLTLLLTIAGLLVVRGATWTFGSDMPPVTILEPSLSDYWIPLLVVALAALAALHVVVFRIGRWTIQTASAHAILELAFAAPVVYLALTGTLVNPAFAEAVAWPALAEADGPVMMWIAVGVVLVTAWEIFDGYRRAWRAKGGAAPG